MLRVSLMPPERATSGCTMPIARAAIRSRAPTAVCSLSPAVKRIGTLRAQVTVALEVLGHDRLLEPVVVEVEQPARHFDGVVDSRTPSSRRRQAARRDRPGRADQPAARERGGGRPADLHLDEVESLRERRASSARSPPRRSPTRCSTRRRARVRGRCRPSSLYTGLPQRLAHEVPQRDVDRRRAPRSARRPNVRRRSRYILCQRQAGVERIAADHPRLQLLVDQRRVGDAANSARAPRRSRSGRRRCAPRPPRSRSCRSCPATSAAGRRRSASSAGRRRRR